jgi:hypothetical protein
VTRIYKTIGYSEANLPFWHSPVENQDKSKNFSKDSNQIPPDCEAKEFPVHYAAHFCLS